MAPFTPKVQPINTWLTFGSWIWWAVAALTGISGAAVMAWLAAQIGWLWSAFGLFGAAFVFVSTFALVMVVIHSFRVTIGWRTRVGLLLIGVAILALIGGGILIARDKGASTETSPVGTSGGSNPATAVSDNWNDNAILQLAFDGELAQATSLKQEGVPYYYWTHIPSVQINFEAKQIQAGIGYVMVFLALKEPTYTNYGRARVLGGGVLCEILGQHSTGAMVRIMGDMRGRTVDIRFSKNPIPLD